MTDDKTVKIIDETLPADDQPARDYVRYGCDGNEYNVLLSAAAGSGKTRTLVDRIVEKVKNLPAGKHIDSFMEDVKHLLLNYEKWFRIKNGRKTAKE